MFIVTVTFSIKPGTGDLFLPHVLAQARLSLSREVDCQQFDVSVDTQDENRVFLYERYTDKPSFDDHLATTHYAEFSKNVGDYILDKQVEFWNLMEQAT